MSNDIKTAQIANNPRDSKIHYAKCRLCGEMIKIDSPIGVYSVDWFISEGGQFGNGTHYHADGSVGIIDYAGYKMEEIE